MLNKIKYNPKIHNRKSIRLKNYDYASNGYYFITICTKNKIEYFGKIMDGKMKLSKIGKIANKCWLEIPKHFLNIKLDEYIIMPNHLHGILIIEKQNTINMVGNKNFCSLQRRSWQTKLTRSLSSIVRGFKIGITKWCRNNNHEYFEWQKSFYDHIIRNEKSLNEIRKYIRNNPLKWELDKNNPENLFI